MMKTGILLFMALLGVAFATKSFPDDEPQAGKSHPHKVSVSGTNNHHAEGGKPSIRAVYERLIQQAANVEADMTLTEKEKKQKLVGLHDELSKLIQRITGVPKELISRQLPNPDAEALRQEFLKEVDQIVKSTTMSDEEKKEAIGSSRNQFRESLKSLHPTAAPKANKQMQKVLEARARADVMSKMQKTMNDPSITQDERKKEFMREMKTEMQRLKQQYMGQGTGPQPHHGGHAKKKVSQKRK